MSNIFTKFIAGEKQSEKARDRRRGIGIMMYAGRNGAGKTWSAVYDTMPDLDKGTPVLSTVRLLDFRNPRPCDDDNCVDQMHGKEGHMAAHPSYIPFTAWEQLINFERGVVLMDEITGIADSGDGVSIPAAVNNLFAQFRRSDIVIRITGLSFIRANKRLRESVIGVTRCRSFFPVQAYDDEGNPLAWKQRRMSLMTTYDAQTLPIDDHTEAAYDKADKIITSRVWIPDSLAIKAYDTYAPVLRVGHVSDAGRCVYCDGLRRVQECSCSDYVAKKAEGKEARSARTPSEHRSSGSASVKLVGKASETDCSCGSHAA